ncbi:hypothetical protein M6B38_325605 [Iris pallida]|uniref:Uncharacterized protein n=1 Tax=Iris pallida TaxID=29817 RepID=A0AAX6H7E7_IRIPA|nr:hypothetical protein M6B38_325605 [Iris pallida]
MSDGSSIEWWRSGHRGGLRRWQSLISGRVASRCVRDRLSVLSGDATSSARNPPDTTIGDETEIRIRVRVYEL